MFYIYRHIRLDTNTPFYVGKGKGRRALKKSSRNSYWMNIVKTAGYKIEIIASDLSEKEAFDKEVQLITLYKNLGYCEANLTGGGEGPSNPCEATRLRMSEAHKGNKGAHSRRVIDTAMGTIYESVEQAAEMNNMKRRTLNAMLSGQNPNKTKLTYYN